MDVPAASRTDASSAGVLHRRSGSPVSASFYGDGLDPKIVYARHAMSLDETCRCSPLQSGL